MVNLADIPSTHKDEVSKTDTRDARAIAMALQCGQLRGIYIPTIEQESDRSLVHRKKYGEILCGVKTGAKGFWTIVVWSYQ